MTDATGSAITSSDTRYIQYRATFTRATSPSQTPVLADVGIVYNLATIENLNGVSVVGANDVWSVGDSGKFFRFNGSSWSEVVDLGADNILTIHMLSATDGWAAGASGKVYRYNGVSWSEFTDTGAEQWNGIRMLSPTSGWIVGNNGEIWQYGGFYRSSGTFLSRVFDGGAGVNWNSLYWTETLPVGADITIATRTGATPIPDITWSAFSAEMTDEQSSVITSPDVRYIQYRTTFTRAANPTDTPVFADITLVYNAVTGQRLNGIDIVAANDIWAVGHNGTIIRYDGTSWVLVASPVIEHIYGIDMVSSSDGWAVGASGKILRYTGGSWSEFIDLGVNDIFDVSMVSATDGWAVGVSGKFYRYNGVTWSEFIDIGAQNVNSVSMLSSTSGWAAADSGKIFQYNGVTWSEVVDIGGQNLFGVHVRTATDGWAVGQSGKILRYNGVSWAEFVDIGATDLFGVFSVGVSDAWAVGQGGVIQKWNGTTWSAAASPTSSLLRKVRMASPFNGWIVGNGGTILHLLVTQGILTSSAFNMADASPTQVVEWDGVIPVCTPACKTRFQVRVAPNAGGAPGVWTGWYGAGGLGTYFTTSTGAFVPQILNGNQWVQYRSTVDGDGVSTPTVQEVRVNYR